MVEPVVNKRPKVLQRGERCCSSHLIVGGDHTHRHPVGISTDAEGVPAAIRHRGYILFIAESEGIEGGKLWGENRKGCFAKKKKKVCSSN